MEDMGGMLRSIEVNHHLAFLPRKTAIKGQRKCGCPVGVGVTLVWSGSIRQTFEVAVRLDRISGARPGTTKWNERGMKWEY